ncbi:hypothetical protein APHAL10511_000802 [Amanita phalloides]|nr:hypothetical protein APHAL10511_000802 [Amanita phalloides]
MIPTNYNTGDPPTNVKLQHAILFCFIFYGPILILPQSIKAAVFLATQGRPEEDYRHRKPFIFLILMAAITLLVSYSLGALITVSRFDGSQFGIPPSVYVVYDFAKELSIVLLYAGLVLLLAYRGSVHAAYQHTIALAVLFCMVLCSIARALIPYPTLRPRPEWRTASDVLFQIYSALYFFITPFIIVWSVRLHQKCLSAASSGRTKPSREEYLFDTNVLRRIVLMTPWLAVRAFFSLMIYALIHHTPITTPFSWESLTLASVVVEGMTNFIVIAISLGLGSIPERRGSLEQGGRKKHGGDDGGTIGLVVPV